MIEGLKILPNSPRVTVVIPAFNAAQFIGEAIESILIQSYENWELLVIDDCSKDETFEIASKYQCVDERIKVIRNEVNSGPGACRALGVTISSGKYISWLDAGDIADPDRLRLQVNFLENNPKVGVVGGSILLFDDSGNFKLRSYDQDDYSLRRKIFRQNPVASPASTYRHEVFTEIGNFKDLRVCEDLEMLLRTGTRWNFANLEQIVIKYRQTNNSVTQSSLRKMELTALNLRMTYRQDIAYKFTVLDVVFNLGQVITLFMPVKLRLWVFLLRRDKKI